MDGAIYEPRSLWSIAYVPSTAAPQRVRVDKNHLFNGERWPITITRLALCGVNYLFRGPTGDQDQPNDTALLLGRVGVRVSVPQRYHLNPVRMAIAGGLPQLTTGQHATPAKPAVYGAGVVPSSLYGQCHLGFDKSLILPKNGQIEWDLSAHTANNRDGESAPTYCEMAYDERGGLTGSSMRSRTVQLAVYEGDTRPTIEGWPYPPDAYTTPAGPAVPPAIGSRNWWPPTSRFPAGGSTPDAFGQRNTSFSAQEATRAGSTEITGLRTTIDQVAYDAQVVGFLPDRPPSPLSLRTGCRIRTNNGGSSGHWWWRPGAPLALVLDTITPATVVRLPEPIVLVHGEQLEVELELPTQSGKVTTYMVGVSFNGYATIEG
jgi:hypothetical protein